MMVETILESSQDFGLANGVLPQWKRELLQRRAARQRPAPPCTPPPPPPPPPLPPSDDDEELRYGPGIVKRLKSRYLSLALRDAPRNRPSVLRRAASLEHLLEPPATAAPAPRPPRPTSLAPVHAQRPAPRRDLVKRARSVDSLSRLEPRDEPPTPPPPTPAPAPPPPPALSPAHSPTPSPSPAPRTSAPRAPRPPRRPAPLLREAERPPPNLVITTLRKFEPAPLRRTHPPLPQSPPPAQEPCGRSPSPSAPASAAAAEPDGAAAAPKPVTRAALEGIARAGSSTRYTFETPRRGGHLPPFAATNPVLLGRARRVGVIRPMPAPALGRATSTPLRPPLDAKLAEEPRDVAPRAAEPTPPRSASPPPSETEPSPPGRILDKREPPLSAMVEPIPRLPPDEPPAPVPAPLSVAEPPSPKPTVQPRPETAAKPKSFVNGYADVPGNGDGKTVNGGPRISSGAGDRKAPVETRANANGEVKWGLGVSGTRGARQPPAATSVVFNFSTRKEVPDYIGNDGPLLRANRRDRLKAGDSGVVVLRPGAGRDSDSEDEGDGECDNGPPSPCRLRFVNDNVLINGRSSLLAARAARDPSRISKLKLQFDDSLTRTFEYPSETSLCEEEEPIAAAPMQLVANTHLASAALARYTPCKTAADAFQLGVAPGAAPPPPPPPPAPAPAPDDGDARPCGADAARSWSDARALATDLLF